MLGRPSGSTVGPPKSIGVEPAEGARRKQGPETAEGKGWQSGPQHGQHLWSGSFLGEELIILHNFAGEPGNPVEPALRAEGSLVTELPF